MKKFLAVLLALLTLCLVFSGCDKDKNNDGKNKESGEQLLEEFLEEKAEGIENDIKAWKSVKISVDTTAVQDGETVTQKYSSILDTSSKVMEIDMSNMETGLDGLNKAYAKGDYIYMETPSTGKIKVSVDDFDMAELLDAASQQESFLFIFKDLDSGKLTDMGVKISVKETDDGGERYTFKLTDDYYEYYYKNMSGMMGEMGLEGMSEMYDLIKITNVDINVYELSYEFDKNGKLIAMTEEADMSCTVDMTDFMIEMFKEMTDTTYTKEMLEAQGVKTVINQSVKGKTIMCETDTTVNINESEYENFNLGY